MKMQEQWLWKRRGTLLGGEALRRGGEPSRGVEVTWGGQEGLGPRSLQELLPAR